MSGIFADYMNLENAAESNTDEQTSNKMRELAYSQLPFFVRR